MFLKWNRLRSEENGERVSVSLDDGESQLCRQWCLLTTVQGTGAGRDAPLNYCDEKLSLFWAEKSQLLAIPTSLFNADGNKPRARAGLRS